jgi:hypothetical protein
MCRLSPVFQFNQILILLLIVESHDCCSCLDFLDARDSQSEHESDTHRLFHLQCFSHGLNQCWLLMHVELITQRLRGVSANRFVQPFARSVLDL